MEKKNAVFFTSLFFSVIFLMTLGCKKSGLKII